MSKSISGHPTSLGPVTAGPSPALVRRAKTRTTPAAPPTETERFTPSPARAAVADPTPLALRFDLKPKQVKAHLDRFVIGQVEAKKVLSVALCDHFNHVRRCLEGQSVPHYQKQNVLLMGPTGVGKTHLIRSAAELIGVPFVKADATKFSETGYVGADVDDLVRDLIRRSNGDLKRAGLGIIYLDEVDKLATQDGNGRDVSGKGVQTNLLKLMEDADVPVLSPNDITGQVQGAMAVARGGAPSSDTINTRHILFIVSGAFAGLADLIRSRLARESSLRPTTTPEAPSEGLIYEHALTTDFITYGFEPEFIGRLPVRVACHGLSEKNLYEVLRRSESSLIHQYVRAFDAYGIRLNFKADGLHRIAHLASTENTGARGLMTICERIFRDLKFELPSTDVRELEVTRELVDYPARVLARLCSKT